MNITELAQSGRRLEKILCRQHLDVRETGFAALVFKFEGHSNLELSVDQDTDELLWNTPISEAPCDLNGFLPVSEAYGLSLTWVWEMKNQQGYFDAFQMELTDSTLAKSIILQFKAAASSIHAFSVSPSGVHSTIQQKAR